MNLQEIVASRALMLATGERLIAAPLQNVFDFGERVAHPHGVRR